MEREKVWFFVNLPLSQVVCEFSFCCSERYIMHYRAFELSPRASSYPYMEVFYEPLRLHWYPRSGDLRQGSSNNSVTKFVLGFSYIFQRETQPSFEDLLLVVFVILRRRFATRFWPEVSVLNFAISEQYFRFSIWSTRTAVSILYSKDRKNFQDIESKWLFSLNYTCNQWCCLIFSAKFREKDRQHYKQNSRCCKDSPLRYGKMTLRHIKIQSCSG